MWWNGPHMFGWGFGLMPILFWTLVVGLVVAAVRASRWRSVQGDPGRPRSSGLSILEERYAKGEIQRDEYLQKKGDLGGKS